MLAFPFYSWGKWSSEKQLPNFKQITIGGIITLKIFWESAVQKELLRWRS